MKELRNLHILLGSILIALSSGVFIYFFEWWYLSYWLGFNLIHAYWGAATMGVTSAIALYLMPHSTYLRIVKSSTVAVIFEVIFPLIFFVPFSVQVGGLMQFDDTHISGTLFMVVATAFLIWMTLGTYHILLATSYRFLEQRQLLINADEASLFKHPSISIDSFEGKLFSIATEMYHTLGDGILDWFAHTGHKPLSTARIRRLETVIRTIEPKILEGCYAAFHTVFYNAMRKKYYSRIREHYSHHKNIESFMRNGEEALYILLALVGKYAKIQHVPASGVSFRKILIRLGFGYEQLWSIPAIEHCYNLRLENGEKLENLDLKTANFEHSYLGRASFNHSNLEQAFFEQAALIMATFHRAALVDVCFDRVDASNASFRGSNLTGASFVGAELFHADFEGCDLTKVDFSNAHIEDVNFYQADLSGAIVTLEQLEGVRTLFQAKGIPAAIRKRLQQTHSHLFTDPDMEPLKEEENGEKYGEDFI